MCPMLHVQNQSSFSPGSQKLSTSPASERGTQIMQPRGPHFLTGQWGAETRHQKQMLGMKGHKVCETPSTAQQ